MADVVANHFVEDVIATVMYFIGRCYYLLLVGWCYCLSMCCLVGGRCCCHCGCFFATCGNVVSFCGRCYCHLCWLMLLPCFFVAVFCGRWYCHLWDWCDWQMLFARVADGIAYPGGCVVTCYNHLWQMEWPLSTLIFQFKFWTVIQNLIPYVRQMVLAYVFV